MNNSLQYFNTIINNVSHIYTNFLYGMRTKQNLLFQIDKIFRLKNLKKI